MMVNSKFDTDLNPCMHIWVQRSWKQLIDWPLSRQHREIDIPKNIVSHSYVWNTGVSFSQVMSKHPWEKIHGCLKSDICNKDGKHLRVTELSVRGFGWWISVIIGNWHPQFSSEYLCLNLVVIESKGLFRRVISKQMDRGWPQKK